MTEALDTDAARHLTTREGWRAFASQRPSSPELLSEDEYAALPDAELEHYNEGRLDHHARLLVVATSTVRHTVTSGRRLILLNRHAVSARRGLIISGPAGTGKTIAITQLGLAHELQDRVRHPDVEDRIPVVYITVPPAATPRMIAAEFARFLGLPTVGKFNITDIIDSVVGVCTKARTGLILVDELHNISLTTRHGAEVADTLKYFSERIAATFIYAGIDIEHSSLLSGTRGAQIAGRFTLIPTHPFPYNQEWKGLVSTMEKTLLLHRHTQGTLGKLDRYLHKRTGGMIGALSHQIRGAAIDAILTGTERITQETLEAIPLDVAAETPQLVSGAREGW
ncbi:ATP-binding protein [Streptomyces griseus]|uniref:ATP-binding protein n=1 Tax=Streptomyces stephensoniae TaxID=3375367 RepID=A0ABU2WB64_9ACTN|nr:ATP-binding protein [Streptomyces griseus]MDT0495124.1 ATP-binding protein [Streptomyces griseus]